MSVTPVGEVRPSQLLWTYGPGALIDLPSLSVVTMGTDQWERDNCPRIQEPRLLAAVSRALGHNVTSLHSPPFQKNNYVNPWSPAATIGVPVRPFPRWMRCVKCGLLSQFDDGAFVIKENRYRPERTHFVHQGCRGSKGNLDPADTPAVPARFLVACRKGHLDDFPWHFFVHGGKSSCGGTLRFFENAASLQTENLWVKCDDCGESRSIVGAFGDAGKKNLPGCRGRHPHLDHFDDKCDEEARAVLLGSTNCWFPVTLSALDIPQSEKRLSRLVRDNWGHLKRITSDAEATAAVGKLHDAGILPDAIKKHSTANIFEAIEIHRANPRQEVKSKEDIKDPEWEVLTSTEPPSDYPHFLSKEAGVPEHFKKQIDRMLLLERLREVNALLGFTRLEAIEESSEPDNRPKRASISRTKPDWVLANQVYGEGIFIKFKEAELRAWEQRIGVKRVDDLLQEGHRGWRNSRKLDPDEGYPGIRFAMLHTLSHLLIRELALECGYSAASIRERIYAKASESRPQAGILIYTAAADSDGTLGGLVDLGNPENFQRLLEQSLNRSKICSSDPLCSEHDPGKDRSLHAAACHACSLVSETSCEKANRFLDRSLLVKTICREDAAFFEDM